MPYNMYLTTNPFDQVIQQNIDIWGAHDPLGLHLIKCTDQGHPQLLECIKSQPAACLPKWKSTLMACLHHVH